MFVLKNKCTCMTRFGLMIWGAKRVKSSLKRFSENTKNEGCKQTHAAGTASTNGKHSSHESSSFLFSCITVQLTKQHGGLIQGRSFANSISCLINNDSRRLPYSSSSLIPRKCCSKLLFSGNPVLIIVSHKNKDHILIH